MRGSLTQSLASCFAASGLSDGLDCRQRYHVLLSKLVPGLHALQQIPPLQPGGSQDGDWQPPASPGEKCHEPPTVTRLCMTLHCCTVQDQLAEQAEQAQFQIKALQAKAEKLQLAAEQALAQKREAEQQRKASERVAHNMKQALDARVVRRVPRAVICSGSHHLYEAC